MLTHLALRYTILMNSHTIKSIDEYLVTIHAETRPIIEKIRTLVKNLVPNGVETIKYRLPTIMLGGKNLVHYAAFKHHIGFYPTPSGITAFEKELKSYQTSTGSIQFPLDKPIPYDLIEKIVRFRIREMNA